jgi:hypothetical protein
MREYKFLKSEYLRFRHAILMAGYDYYGEKGRRQKIQA